VPHGEEICRAIDGEGTPDSALSWFSVNWNLAVRAELIAEIYRQRWLIEMFFRLFKHILGCRHLISDKHNGAEIQASCGMIVCRPSQPGC